MNGDAGLHRTHKSYRSYKSYKLRGIILLEVLVAAALLGIGVAAALGGLGTLTRVETDVREREEMQRLAHELYDDVVATGDYVMAPLEGDFEDRGETRYQWRVEFDPTGVENLNELIVTVSPRNRARTGEWTARGLLFVPPATQVGAAQ